MNYKKVYNNLILSAKSKNRAKSKEDYFELHHIKPKCVGGDNSEDNLVLLTAREHFIAHKLLIELCPRVSGLIYAVILMCGSGQQNNFNEKYSVSAREYERYRILASKSTRKKRTEEYLANMAKARIGKKASEETKLRMSKSRTGKVLTESHRKRMSEVRIGHHVSEETKSKISEARLKGEILTCPHCGKSGKGGPMHYYHFDNCKLNPLSFLNKIDDMFLLEYRTKYVGVFSEYQLKLRLEGLDISEVKISPYKIGDDFEPLIKEYFMID